MSSAAVYWMLHLLVEPAGTGAEGVMMAVPLPALAMADTHAATESTVNAPKNRSHRGVKRRGRITALSNNPGVTVAFRTVRTAASAHP